MSFASDLLKKAAKITAENSPAILTAIGVAGTVTTAYLTAKATLRVGVQIGQFNAEAEANGEAEGLYSAQEVIDFVRDRELWKPYIPAIAVGVGTIVCIIGANHVSSKRAAGVAAAYSLLEKSATEYQHKVVEKIGEKKEQQIRSEVLEDRLRARDPFDDDSIEVHGKPQNGSVFQDSFSQMYIWTSRDELGAAMNDLGRTIVNVGYATLADFYYRMDIPAPAYASEIGWNSDDELPRPVYSSAMSPGEVPVNAFDFSVKPSPRYLRFH